MSVESRPGILRSKIAEAYFRPKPFEQGDLYEKTGVRQLKQIITKSTRNTNLFPNYFLQGYAIDNLKSYDDYTRKYEVIHLSGVILSAIGVIANHESILVVAHIATLGLIHLGPLLVQRYNRMRIYKILES